MKKGKKPTKAQQASLLKQKDKDEAESIVAELKRMSRQPKRYVDMISNVAGNPSVSEIAIDPGNPISMVNSLFLINQNQT